MRLTSIKIIYGEDSKEYKEALQACIEQAEKDRKICDDWRDQLKTEKVRIW